MKDSSIRVIGGRVVYEMTKPVAVILGRLIRGGLIGGLASEACLRDEEIQAGFDAWVMDADVLIGEGSEPGPESHTDDDIRIRR